MAEPLRYQRLLEIIRKLPGEEAAYVLRFLTANDRKVRDKVASLDREQIRHEKAAREYEKKMAEEKSAADVLQEKLARLRANNDKLGRERRSLLGELNGRLIRMNEDPAMKLNADYVRKTGELAATMKALLQKDVNDGEATQTLQKNEGHAGGVVRCDQPAVGPADRRVCGAAAGPP